MEILSFPAVLLLFLSDSQLIRYVSVSEKRGEKHFSWQSGSDWLAGTTRVCVLLVWALLPEKCVRACVHARACVLCMCFYTGVCVCHAGDIKASGLVLDLPAHFTLL